MKLKNYIVTLALGLFGLGLATSCDDMLDYEDGANTAVGKLDNPSDTVTYVLGIISKMQALGVRTNILGEVRGDLVEVLSNATTDMKNIANFDFSDNTALINNRFNQPSDYYAVINNCNTFLHYVDTKKETTQPYVQDGNVKYKKLFEREYAVVKFFRAWVYLQLAINYGENIPFQTEPVLTINEAMSNPNRKNMVEIIDWFLNNDNLEECCKIIDEQKYPHWDKGEETFLGTCHYWNLFFPGDVVIGDLYLWRSVLNKSKDDALEAARHYYRYLCKRQKLHESTPMSMVCTDENSAKWTFSNGAYDAVNKTYSKDGSQRSSNKEMIGSQAEYKFDNEVVSVLLMDVANSEDNYNMLNKYYSSSTDASKAFEPACIVPSNRLKELSDTMTYCGGKSEDSKAVIFSKDIDGKKETIVYDDDDRTYHRTGDLRFSSYVEEGAANNIVSEGQVLTITNLKHNADDKNGLVSQHVTVYRLTEVFLKLAEAMNYAGYPHYANAILSFGVNDDTMDGWILPNSDVNAEVLLKQFSWDKQYFVTPVKLEAGTMHARTDVEFNQRKDKSNYPDVQGVNIGIHSRGSGSTHWNDRYYQLTNLESVKRAPEAPKGPDGKVQTELPEYMERPEKPAKPSPGIMPNTEASDKDKQPDEIRALYLYPFNPAHPDDPTEDNVNEVTDVTVDNIYPEEECRAKWLDYYKKVYPARKATQQENTKWKNLSPSPYLKRVEYNANGTFYLFNPLHDPAETTEENYTDTTDILTVNNVFNSVAVKDKWLDYYQACGRPNPQVEMEAKWMHLSAYPYAKVATNLADYIALWKKYKKGVDEYEEDLKKYKTYSDRIIAYFRYLEYLQTDYKNWRHEARSMCLEQDQQMVAKMVLDEQALEFAYEGKRFYDLMRYAFWKGSGYGAPDTRIMVDAIGTRNNYKYDCGDAPKKTITRGSGVVGDLSNYKTWFLRFWPSDEVGVGPKE